MAVAPAQRGRGLGRRLYRSLGFRRVRRHPFAEDAYQRETIVMVLDLNLNEKTDAW